MFSAIRLDINVKLTVFTVAFLPLLIYLGFWQLSRADEKASLLALWQQQQSHQPIPLNPSDINQYSAYQAITFSGRYQSKKYWLQEGKINQGQPGYNVIMPFILDSGQTILIDRGWVPANPDRRILPSINSPQGNTNIIASIKKNSDSPLTEEQDNPLKNWPHRILEVDIPLMAEQLGHAILSKLVVLNKEQVSAFIVLDSPINMPPSKHNGYAVQWFGLSLALIILWFFSNTNVLACINKEKLGNQND